MKIGKIYGISLGPGDPELITVKGLNLLRQVDKIYYPGSLAFNGKTSSYSLNILKYFELDEQKFCGMFLNMSDDRTINQQVYADTYQKIKTDYDAGLQIAFVSEGDISFYSTFAYLLQHIRLDKLMVEIIAGVPSFLLAAATHKMPLAMLGGKIAILPRMKNLLQIESYLNDFETIVLIKIRNVIAELIQLQRKNTIEMVYCEKLGCTDQFLTVDMQELLDREIPYFSLMILKKSCNIKNLEE